MLVLEALLVTLGESLVENPLLLKVSWKMLVLEAWIVTFGESLVGNLGFVSLCPARVSSRVSWKSA